MCFSPFSDYLLTGGYDGSTRVYSLPRAILQDLQLGDGRHCIAAYGDSSLKYIDLTTAAVVKAIKCPSTPESICEFTGGAVFVTGDHDGALRGWDMRTGTCQFEIRLHKAKVIQVHSGPNCWVSVGADKRLCFAENRLTGVGLTKGVIADQGCDILQFGVCKSRALLGNCRGAIDEYDLATMTKTKTSVGASAEILCLAAKSGAGIFASGDKSGSVMLWDL
jgi:WD40 repeat protein